MGAGLVQRATTDGHEAVIYDRNQDMVQSLVGEKISGASSAADLVSQLDGPRVVWIMVPVAFAGAVVEEYAALLSPGDIVIDGGNSMWQDDVDRGEALAGTGIHYVDIGTSGGVYGIERGFSMMVGGSDEAIATLTPLLDSLASGVDFAERTIDGPERPGEKGWLHCGPIGAGHFVKMVHNGIEYGMMASLAEGLGILEAAGFGKAEREKDAETTPLRDPKYYQYDMDTAAITEVWRRGSVISSWLVDLTAHALAVDPDLDAFEGRVSDSGMGRWTVQAAVELGVPASAITSSLYARFASRNNDDFTNRSLSAMRKEFGGHHEKKS